MKTAHSCAISLLSASLLAGACGAPRETTRPSVDKDYGSAAMSTSDPEDVIVSDQEATGEVASALDAQCSSTIIATMQSDGNTVTVTAFVSATGAQCTAACVAVASSGSAPDHGSGEHAHNDHDHAEHGRNHDRP